MKGLVYHGPNVMSYDEVPNVQAGEGEVLVRPKAVGICGSDVHGYLGITGRRIPPMIMGHEFSGVIEKLGPGATGFKPGDRVAVYPVDFCGACEPCRQGNSHLCLHRRQFGVLKVDGAFADFLAVPAKCCFRLKDDVSFEVGSLMEPLAVSYRAVNRAGAERITGKNVFMVGTGTIGLLALACVKLLKPAQIIVSDLSDTRLQIAKQMGATQVVNPGREDVVDAVKSLTDGKGADTAFEAVGAAATVQQAMSALSQSGTAVWIGNNKKMIEINMQEIVTRELTVFGTFLYGFEEFKQVVDLLNNGKIDASPMISHLAPMSDGPTLFAKLAKDPGDWIKVILTNP